MNWIAPLVLLTALHSSIVISAQTDETIVLVCDAEVIKAVNRVGVGTIEIEVIREETGTMIIRGQDRTVSFLNEYVTDWGIYRSSEGIIDGGPEQQWIRTGADGTEEIKTVYAKFLEVDPYSGRFEFFPNGKVLEGGAEFIRVPIGSTFYQGTCRKTGKLTF